LELDTHLLII